MSEEVIAAALGGLVGALLGAVVTAALGWWGFVREDRHRRQDDQAQRLNLQNEYVVGCSVDLATQVRTAMDAVRVHVPGTNKDEYDWRMAYALFSNVRTDLQAQRPRYRLAGLTAACDDVIKLFGGYLYWVSFREGQWSADRDLAKAVEAMKKPSSQEGSAAKVWTVDEVETSYENFRQVSISELFGQLEIVLSGVADYEPGPSLVLQPIKNAKISLEFPASKRVRDDWESTRSASSSGSVMHG